VGWNGGVTPLTLYSPFRDADCPLLNRDAKPKANPVIISVNDIVEAKIYCHSQGQFSINTVHYKCTAIAGGGSTDDIFAGELAELFAPRIKACLSEQAEYVGLTAQIIRPTRRPKVLNTVDVGDGLVTGDILPRQVAGLISKKTSTASRSGRGRMYVPFPAESTNTEDGFPVAGYKTNLELLATVFLTTVVSADGGNTSTMVPVLYNRNSHATLILTGATVQNVWGTCRRRADVRGADRFPF